MILVFAGTPHEAHTFIEKLGYTTREDLFKHIRSLSVIDFIYGTSNCVLVFVGTWYMRDTKEVYTVEQYCKEHNITMLLEREAL